jgi:hypothetical protein
MAKWLSGLFLFILTLSVIMASQTRLAMASLSDVNGANTTLESHHVDCAELAAAADGVHCDTMLKAANMACCITPNAYPMASTCCLLSGNILYVRLPFIISQKNVLTGYESRYLRPPILFVA